MKCTCFAFDFQHASDKVPPTGSGVKARVSLEDVETSSTTTESSESFAADQRDIDDLSKPSTGKGSKKNNKQQASSKIAAEAVKKSAVAAATGKQPSGKNSGCKQATPVEKKAVANCVKANNATAVAAGEKQVTSVKANGATTKPGLVKQKSTDGTDGVGNGSVSSSPVLSSAANATPPPFEPQQVLSMFLHSIALKIKHSVVSGLSVHEVTQRYISVCGFVFVLWLSSCKCSEYSLHWVLRLWV